MKKTSVVILNWNGQKLLEQFMPSLLEHTNLTDTEIIIADNHSSDGSIVFLQKYYPSIRLIELPENYGFAKGYNEALKKINSEYLVLLNSDVEVSAGWLSSMVNYADENKDVAAIQPKILSHRSKDYFEYAGACGGFIDKYGYPFCRGRIFNSLEKDHNQYDTIIDIFWASGACLFIRLEEFKAIGGFDDVFFAHMEEIDLCWRLNSRAKRIVCLPQSVVYHVGAATLSAENPRKTFLNFRNNLLMLYKNLPQKQLVRTLRIRLFLDSIATLQFLLNGKTKNAKAVLKAHKEYRKLKKYYVDIRRHNLENTTVTDIKTIYKRSILYAYYLRFRKTYNKISF